MSTQGTDRFWYEAYKEGVKHDIISKDETIEAATPLNDNLQNNEREIVDGIYTSIKKQIDEPEFDLEEAAWFFDLAKAELKRRLTDSLQ